MTLFEIFLSKRKFHELPQNLLQRIGRSINLRARLSLLNLKQMVLDDAFEDNQSHRANVGSMVRDQVKVELFVAHRYDLWTDRLKFVQQNLTVQAAELTTSTEADNEGLEGGNEVRARKKH